MTNQILLIALATQILTSVCSAQSYNAEDIQLRPVRYKMDITLDYENNSLATTLQFSFYNSSGRSAERIPLLLYRLLHVDQITDKSGGAVVFEQEVLTFDDWSKYQGNYIVAELNSPLASGDTATLTINYSGHLLGYSETGMLYVQDNIDTAFTILRMDANAYPMIGVPSFGVNRALGLPSYDYQVSITAPEYLTVANGGELIDRRASNGQVTYTYQNLKPAWRMDFAIANYITLKNGANIVFCFPEDSAGGARTLEQLQQTLELYTDWFGPLKGADAFTVIEIPDGWGSQADVTSIIQTAATFKSLERSVELYHEVSHMWNVMSTETHSPRWNEGLAMFLQHYTADKLQGTNKLTEAANSRWERVKKMFSDSPERAKIAMIDYGKENVTGMSYSVGMVMFYLLNELVGETRFKEIVGEYYSRYYNTGAGTEEFITLAGKLSGDNAAEFLREWFYTTKPAERALAQVPLNKLLASYRR